MAEYCPPYVSNYVCTGKAETIFPNTLVATAFGRSGEQVFPCSNISGISPRVNYQVFGNGNLVLSGAKNREEALWGQWKFLRLMSEFLDKPIRPKDFKPQNIVVFGGLGYEFDQKKFYEENRLSLEPPEGLKDLKPDPPPTVGSNKKRRQLRGATMTEYKPSRFKGMQFFAKYPLVGIFFPTGKYVFTGSRHEENILKAINCMDWSKYKLREGMTSDKMKQHAEALASRYKTSRFFNDGFVRAFDYLCKRNVVGLQSEAKQQ